jgi:hypothetical protein
MKSGSKVRTSEVLLGQHTRLDLTCALSPLAGITLLSNVLDKAPAARINRQGSTSSDTPSRNEKLQAHWMTRPYLSAQVLTSFYCDKLEDHECVPSTLKGLVVLTKLPTFGAGEASQVFRS